MVEVVLETIRDFTRKMTGRYTEEQLTNDEIDESINQGYQLLLPDSLRTFRLRVPYNITTIPNQDTYNFPYELYNSVEPQAYAGGYPMQWFQSRTEFYNLWPKLHKRITLNGVDTFSITGITLGTTTQINSPGNTLQINDVVFFSDVTGTIEINDLSSTVIATGDIFTVSLDTSVGFSAYTGGGVVKSNSISGTINNIPFLRAQISASDGESTDPDGEVQTSNVIISIAPANGQTPIVGKDTSFNGDVGVITGNGISGNVNYVTGEYHLSFEVTPPSDTPIYAQIINYGASRPLSVLFFNNQFTLRPVPAEVFQIEMVAYKTPTQLLAENTPALKEWIFLLASLASKIIYMKYPDPEGQAYVEKIYQEQIDMMETRTVKQLGNERATSIISSKTRNNYLGYFLPYQNL